MYSKCLEQPFLGSMRRSVLGVLKALTALRTQPVGRTAQEGAMFARIQWSALASIAFILVCTGGVALAQAPASVEDIEKALMPDIPAKTERARSFVTRGISSVGPDAETPKPVTSAVYRESIKFRKDSAELTEEGMKQIDKIAVALGRVKTRSMAQGVSIAVRLGGHASREGESEHNRRLSERRAQAVKEYLQRYFKFTEAEFAEVRGFGADAPLSGASPYDEANRRVEFQTVGKSGS
jgi:outer membrane protein OmpA-like peptidoglycan-associated protein